MFQDFRIREVMVRPVITAKQDDSFYSVEEKLRQKGIRHLPVVDENERVVGLITQRDLYRIVSPRVTEDGLFYDKDMLEGFILKHVMKKNPFTLKPDDSFSKAVATMASLKYGCIPIVDKNGRIAGILTETDILKWLAKQL